MTDKDIITREDYAKKVMATNKEIDQLLDSRLTLQQEAASIKIQLDLSQSLEDNEVKEDTLAWRHKARTALSYKNIEVRKIDQQISKIRRKAKELKLLQAKEFETKKKDRILLDLLIKAVKEKIGDESFKAMYLSVNLQYDEMMAKKEENKKEDALSSAG